MNKQRALFKLCLVQLLFLYGCTKIYELGTEKLPTITPVKTTKTTNISPTFTLKPTQTNSITLSLSIPATKEETLFVTATPGRVSANQGFPPPVPGYGISRSCLTIADVLPKNFIPPNFQIIRFCDKRACSLNFNNHEFHEEVFSPTELIGGSWPRISLDGKWLAYMQFDSNIEITHLWVVSATKEEQKSFSWRGNWAGFDKWSRKQTLIILDKDQNIIEFDPFTDQEIQISQPQYPEDIDPGGLLGPTLDFSLDWNQIVYLKENYNFTYFDFDLEKVLWERPAYPQAILNLEYAKWSPDGKHVAIAAGGEIGGELYIVGSGGTVKFVTNFSSAYPDNFIIVGNFEWSPDGRHIALWINLGNDDAGGDIWHLAVLNTESEQMIDFCIPSYGFGAHYYFPEIFWSPDSSYVAAESYYDEDDNFQVVLDITRKKAVMLPEADFYDGWGDYLIGWLVKNPK